MGQVARPSRASSQGSEDTPGRQSTVQGALCGVGAEHPQAGTSPCPPRARPCPEPWLCQTGDRSPGDTGVAVGAGAARVDV